MTAETSATATTRFVTAGEPSMLLPVTVACGVFMTSLDQNVVVTALPGIGESLDRPPSQLGLLITVYVASLIVTMPLGGWLADRFGLRNVYCFALLVFASASALCGLSENIWMLVGSRALQGFGGALMGTLGQVVILSSFPRDRTLKINTYISLAGQSGPLVGPLVGGALTTYVSWRWIFYINIPVALTAALLAASLFPSTTKPVRTPFDFPGFLLVGGGMVLLVFGMDSLAAKDAAGGMVALELGLAIGILSVAALYCLRVGGGMVLLVFGMDSLAAKDAAGGMVALELGLAIGILSVAALYCLRARNPLLDLKLLRIRTFRISFLTGGGLDTIGLSSVVFLLPLMFQLGFGMSAVQAGSLTFVAAIGSVAIRFFMPRLLNRFGFRRVLVVNTPIVALLVAGFALMQESTPHWIVLTYIFVFGLFRSVQWASTGNLAYSDIAPEQLSRFSALYYILWQLAVAISVGLAAALLSLLAGGGVASINDYRVLFAIEGLITLCALLAYLRLTPQDGAHVSGHGAQLSTE